MSINSKFNPILRRNFTHGIFDIRLGMPQSDGCGTAGDGRNVRFCRGMARARKAFANPARRNVRRIPRLPGEGGIERNFCGIRSRWCNWRCSGRLRSWWYSSRLVAKLKAAPLSYFGWKRSRSSRRRPAAAASQTGQINTVSVRGCNTDAPDERRPSCQLAQ